MKARDEERHLVCDHRAFVVLPETKSRTVAQTPGRGALGLNVPKTLLCPSALLYEELSLYQLYIEKKTMSVNIL